ncbi:MAG TPA: RNA polymerase sigma factor [Chloroflexota bacterium]
MAEAESRPAFSAIVRDPSRRWTPGWRPVITSAQLERVYTSFFGSIYGFIFARVGNKEDAEDLTSNVFMKSLQYLDPSAAPQEVAAYLYRIARTEIADHWRRYAALRVVPIDEEPEALQVEEASEEVVIPSLPTLVGELERILAFLPPNYRRVLELRFFEGHTIKETARAMHVSEGNAKVLQYRAIQRAAACARETETGP